MRLDWSWVTGHVTDIGGLVGIHLLLALTPVVAALILAMPVGYLVHRTGAGANGLLVLLGLLSSVPALALFILLPVLLQRRVDPLTIGLALTVYALARLVRSVVAGLRAVPASVTESAAALGYGRLGRLTKVELPLASPAVFTGLRAVTVSSIALVTISVLAGQPSLGSLFDQGYTQHLVTPVVVGLVLCVVLAGLADGLILLVRRGALRWRTAARA